MLYVQCPYSLEIPAITKQINKKTLCNGYKFYLAPNLGVFRVIKYVYEKGWRMTNFLLKFRLFYSVKEEIKEKTAVVHLPYFYTYSGCLFLLLLTQQYWLFTRTVSKLSNVETNTLCEATKKFKQKKNEICFHDLAKVSSIRTGLCKSEYEEGQKIMNY